MQDCTEPLKIAHIMAGAQNGGAELFYERLSIAQHQQGMHILPVIRRNVDRADILRKAGLFPHELKFGGVFDWRSGIGLKQILRNFQPRVAIAWMNRAARFMPVGNWVSVGRLGGFYNLRYYRKCDHLVGNTKGIVRWVKEQGWDEKRVHYVPNFAREFTVNDPHHPDFIPKNAPFLLALGRLHRNKGFDVLIKAMVYVKEAHLLIAGEGDERYALQKLADSLGVGDRVHMPGWVNNISGIVQACDILVCSSRHEPLGNVVLEGFAATKPVVAMASQGPVELIDHEENGLLSPLEDEVLMAKAIQRVLDQPEFSRKLALAGRRKFDAEFNRTIVLQKWVEFLSTVEKN